MFSWRRKCLELDQEGFRKLLEKLTTPSLLSISLFGNSNFESSQEGFVQLYTILWRCGRYSEYIEAPVLHCNCTVMWRRVMLEGKQGFTGYDRRTFSSRWPDYGTYYSHLYWCANIILWYRPRVMISQFHISIKPGFIHLFLWDMLNIEQKAQDDILITHWLLSGYIDQVYWITRTWSYSLKQRGWHLSLSWSK